MNVVNQAKRINRETAIEDAIIARPEVQGFRGAVAIRNFRVADTAGVKHASKAIALSIFLCS
jgi:hypothetical protein